MNEKPICKCDNDESSLDDIFLVNRAERYDFV